MSRKSEFQIFVNKMRDHFESIKRHLKLIIVANREDTKEEYLINRSMDAIVKLCTKHDLLFDFYVNENDFINEYLAQKMDVKNEDKFVFIYNRSTSGPWGARRILIPAFCKFNNINYLGNNAYLMGLLCHKFHYLSILKNIDIPVAETWCFDYKYGWLTQPPPEGVKIIIKLANENNAESIDKNSVFIYSSDRIESIRHLSEKHLQPVVVQKFINGFEVTVPVFISEKIFLPNVLGCRLGSKDMMGNEFISGELSEARLLLDRKRKYFDFDEINEYASKNIINDSKKIVEILGIKGFSRFDLRVDESFSHYFNDLGSIPGILPESAFQFVYELNGFDYEDFIVTTICMDINKSYLDQYCIPQSSKGAL